MLPSLMMLLVLSSALVALVTYLPRVHAQTSSVQCSPSYKWAYNSLGQTPCLIAAWLQGVCAPGGKWSVDSLPAGTYYSGPLASGANVCQCNSVVYALISACADCQGRQWVSWSTWDANCSNPILDVYPMNIPTGTAVPDWAYFDVSQTDNYIPSVASARAVQDKPESTAVKTATATPATSTQAQGSLSKSTKVAVIAGSTVGGVLVLGASIILAAWLVMRQRRLHRSSQPANGTLQMGGPVSSHSDVTPSIAHTTQKLYNPSDPSTFPPSPASQTIHTTPLSYQPMPSSAREAYVPIPAI